MTLILHQANWERKLECILESKVIFVSEIKLIYGIEFPFYGFFLNKSLNFWRTFEVERR